MVIPCEGSVGTHMYIWKLPSIEITVSYTVCFTLLAAKLYDTGTL